MKIENLSKDLDTVSMTGVRGGTALTGQVVPTNVQGNALEQAFNIKANGPVAIANDATATYWNPAGVARVEETQISAMQNTQN